MLTFFNELASEPLGELFADGSVARFLAQGGHALSMAMIDLTEERACIVRDLEARGVRVTAWLLLDVDEGYWFNADNAEQAILRYRETIAWAERENLQLHRIGLDIESPRSEVTDAWNRPLGMLWQLLLQRRSGREIEAAQQRYGELVDEIRLSGRSVETYHLPFIIDERRAGSTLLRRVLGLLDLPADLEVFMLYDTYLGETLALSYFSEARGIGLGVTGGGVNADDRREKRRLLTAARLARQCAAARAHGADVYIFSLEGCVWNGMLDDRSLLEAPATAGARIASDRRGRLLRAGLRFGLRAESIIDAVLPRRTRS